MPVAEWVDLVEGSGVEVHPSPDSGAIAGDGNATLEMYRAAASNCYAMGAHGFYVFNLFCAGYPLEEEQYQVMREVSHPAALSRRDKLEPDERLDVGLNGRWLDLGAGQVRVPSRRQTIANSTRLISGTYQARELAGSPGIWLEIGLCGENPTPVPGDNLVSIRRRSGVGAPVKVVNVNLRTTYDYCGR